MDEFTMSATALYPEERSGEAFAEVSARTLLACFAAMAIEVARWLAAALSGGAEGSRPQAIELTFRWGGPAAPGVVPEAPERPREGGERAEPPASPRRARCTADGARSRRRRLLRPGRLRLGAGRASYAPAGA
jgi:hypothetical protein